jgi:hypothetical protein
MHAGRRTSGSCSSSASAAGSRAEDNVLHVQSCRQGTQVGTRRRGREPCRRAFEGVKTLDTCPENSFGGGLPKFGLRPT